MNVRGLLDYYNPPDGEGWLIVPRGGEITPRVVAYLTDPALGHLDYWQRSGGEILPPPPDGFSWYVDGNGSLHRVRPYEGVEYVDYRALNYRYDWRIVLASDEEPWMGYDQPAGPSVFLCAFDCLHRTGCSACNPSVWRRCESGHCPDSRRIPVEYPEDSCPCFRTCGDCGDPVSPGDLCEARDEYGNDLPEVCRHCRARDYTTCDHCDYSVPDDLIGEHEDRCSECCDCGTCQTDNSNDNDPDSVDCINSYGYQPSPRFHGEDTYYLGMECEVSTESAHTSLREVAESVAGNLGEVGYLKEDSSIGRGFEIVTHPMSYEYAMDSFPWRIYDDMRSYGMTNSPDCGIHVHVSRTGFNGPSHVYRWLKFFYRNGEAIQQVARRRGNSYAKFSPAAGAWAIHHASKLERISASCGCCERDGDGEGRWYTKTAEGRRRIREFGEPGRPDRYSAINVLNSATFEVRIFASTLYRSQAKAALGLVHATVEYTRGIDAHAILTRDALTFDSFRAWVKDNNTDGKYAALLSEIERLVN